METLKLIAAIVVVVLAVAWFVWSVGWAILWLLVIFPAYVAFYFAVNYLIDRFK